MLNDSEPIVYKSSKSQQHFTVKEDPSMRNLKSAVQRIVHHCTVLHSQFFFSPIERS